MGSFDFLPQTNPSWPGLSFQLAQSRDVQDMCQFLMSNFFLEVPTIAMVNLDPEKEIRPWICSFVSSMVDDGHSIIVRDTVKDDRLVAVCLSSVIENKEGNVSDLSKIVNPVENPLFWFTMDLFGRLNEDLNLFEEYQTDRILHLLFISVNSQYGGRGIAEKFAKLSIEMAKQEGVKALRVEALSYFTYRAMVKAGFEIINEIDYKDFVSNGSKPFVNDGVHQKARLMMLKLD